RQPGERFSSGRRGGARPGAGVRPNKRSSEPALGRGAPLNLDPLGLRALDYYTLFASSGDPTVEVRAALRGTTSWRGASDGEVLGPAPSRLADGLRVGDRVAIDLAMAARPEASGDLAANILLNVQPR